MNFRAILRPSRQMGTRAFSICAVVTFLIFPGYALSRESKSLSTVCLDNNGQHEEGRFSMPDEIVPRKHKRTVDTKLKGHRFGTLVVLGLGETKRGKGYLLRCLCENCGDIVERSYSTLLNVQSCGCLRNVHRVKTHRATGTRTHRIWAGMKDRCLNPNRKEYKNYGGRGISVAERWLKFENFLADTQY